MKGYIVILAILLLFPHHFESRCNAYEPFIDIDLPSNSTGSPTGTLAVRIYPPSHPRYPEGAPVLIYVAGADSPGGLRNCLPSMDDVIVIYFIFPGGVDFATHRSSDGTYDHRGQSCILALRDVILYAAGKCVDAIGRKIDDVVSIPVLHNNIGLLGCSNGGNIVIATPAIYGKELNGYLRYIIQWESPVSSQIATVDLGPIRFNCTPNNYVNPRYKAYGYLSLDVDYSDLTYNKSCFYKVFHDGNGDGKYTTIIDPSTGLPTPDLNLNGILELNEDFPLSAYTDGRKQIYSRPVTHALANVISSFPPDIATPTEADAYWDIREAVRMYDDAIKNIPDLKGMILASVKDHVQSAPDKPHIHQAFDGWNKNNAWVKINPSPRYLIEADPSLKGIDLPDNLPNIPPSNWSSYEYCIPEIVPDDICQVAATFEMADRTYYRYGIKANISGGFGVKVLLKNEGVEDAENIPWEIDINGRIIFGGHAEGNISLKAGETKEIKCFVFGIGKAEITVKIGNEEEKVPCFILAPFVFLSHHPALH